MKIINIPVLGSFVKYSDYENTVKTLQDVTTNNEELYKREQEALILINQMEDDNVEVHKINLDLYDHISKLHSQIEQAKKESYLIYLGCVFLGVFGMHVINLTIHL